MAKINFQHLLAVFAVLHASTEPLATKQVDQQVRCAASASLKCLDGLGFIDKRKRGRSVLWGLTDSARRMGRQALIRLQQEA